jgi:repressor LexA
MPRAELSGPAGQDLTPRQRRIIEVIEDSVRCSGYAPTMREIGDAVGLASTSSVAHQLSQLQKKG